MYLLMRKPTKEEQVAVISAVVTLVKVGKIGEFYPMLSPQQTNDYWEEKRIITKEELEVNGFESSLEGWKQYARYAILPDSSDEVEIYSA